MPIKAPPHKEPVPSTSQAATRIKANELLTEENLQSDEEDEVLNIVNHHSSSMPASRVFERKKKGPTKVETARESKLLKVF